ncbi:MAG: hypothetical protein J6K55_01125 [Clostridia bacterium]|nr:hypothetical protein [Clostridia bacterium]
MGHMLQGGISLRIFLKWLICTLALLMLPVLALAADDTITVPYVDYSSYESYESAEADLGESAAFVQWITEKIPAELTEQSDQLEWMEENTKLSYTSHDLSGVWERFWFSYGPDYPAVVYELASVNENSYIAITAEISGETFTVEWNFEDTGLRAVKPKVTGDITTSDGMIYVRSGAELMIEFRDYFSSDSPYASGGYHEAVFERWDGQEEILSSGAGSAVVQLKCPADLEAFDDFGKITYTYGALSENSSWTEGYEDWAVKKEYSFWIVVRASETADADETSTAYYTPGFPDLFADIFIGIFDEPFSANFEFYEMVEPWVMERAPLNDSGFLDLTWCQKNLDVKWEYENIVNPQGTGFSEERAYSYGYGFPTFSFDMSRVSEDSWITCAISMKNDPSDKLVLKRLFKDSGLVPVEPTIIGARNVIKTGAHRYEVHVQEGDVLNVKLNDYFRTDVVLAPRRYYWFTLSNFEHEDWYYLDRWTEELEEYGYRKQLNAGWGIGSQSLEITSEHDGLHLLGYYGGSHGVALRSARGWDGLFYRHETYDYAAVGYTIDIVVDREVPQTGDDSHLLLWSTCALLSLMGAAGSVKRKKA